MKNLNTTMPLFKLFSLFGVPLYTDICSIWMLPFFFMSSYWTTFVILTSLFLITLLRKYCFVLSAKWLGYNPEKVFVSSCIGFVWIDRDYMQNSKHELLTSIAAPIAQLALVPILFILTNVTNDYYIASLNFMNIVVLLLNLFPMLPLDGGWICRSLLYGYLKDFLKATHFTFCISCIFAFLTLFASFFFEISKIFKPYIVNSNFATSPIILLFIVILVYSYLERRVAIDTLKLKIFEEQQKLVDEKLKTKALSLFKNCYTYYR